MARKKKPIANTEDLRAYLAIDKYSLDDEIVKQPRLYEEIGEACALASAEHDYAKDGLNRLYAELATKHRKKIENTTGARATEAQVNAAVISDKKHVDASNKRIEAKQRLDELSAVKEAFHQRSYMLRDLSALYIANYYEKSTIVDSNSVKDVKARKSIDKMDQARKAKGSRNSMRKRNKN